MQQDVYEKILTKYIEENIELGTEAFRINYFPMCKKVKNHMESVLRGFYKDDLAKRKTISSENAKRLNIWLDKMELVPTTISK